jgi:hypothetical protein
MKPLLNKKPVVWTTPVSSTKTTHPRKPNQPVRPVVATSQQPSNDEMFRRSTEYTMMISSF